MPGQKATERQPHRTRVVTEEAPAVISPPPPMAEPASAPDLSSPHTPKGPPAQETGNDAADILIQGCVYMTKYKLCQSESKNL